MLPLAEFPRYVFNAGETVAFAVRIANYGREDLEGSCTYRLTGSGVSFSGGTASFRTPAGSLSGKKEIRFRMPDPGKAARLELALTCCGYENVYSLWVYPDAEPVCPPDVLECRTLDGQARQVLANGGKVFLAPDSTEKSHI